MVSILALTSVKEDMHRITNVQLGGEEKRALLLLQHTVQFMHTKLHQET